MMRIGEASVMNDVVWVISPIDGREVVGARHAPPDWAELSPPLGARHVAQAMGACRWPASAAASSGVVDRMAALQGRDRPELAADGPPDALTPGGGRRLRRRARYMAPSPARRWPVRAGAEAGFGRFIRREPLGVVLVVAPWNYPCSPR